MKKKIIIVVLVLVVLGIGFYFKDDIAKIKHYVYPIQSSKKLETKEKIEKEQIVQEDSKEEINEEKIESKEEVKNNNNSSKKETTKSNKNNTKTETKTETINNQKAEQPKQDPPKNNNQESGAVDSNGNEVKEEKAIVVNKTPWESLGISEYDYYHKPVYSWMRVDYPVSSCGSVTNCESQCMNGAEELSYTENVSCIQIYSYSGSYLGEMLKR